MGSSRTPDKIISKAMAGHAQALPEINGPCLQHSGFISFFKPGLKSGPITLSEPTALKSGVSAESIFSDIRPNLMLWGTGFDLINLNNKK